MFLTIFFLFNLQVIEFDVCPLIDRYPRFIEFKINSYALQLI